MTLTLQPRDDPADDPPPPAGRWLWQAVGWPSLRFDAGALATAIGQARLAQGRLVGKTEALDELGQGPAQQQVWAEEAVATSAIEGERLDVVAVRSSVARRLGLTSAGTLPPRAVEGLLDIMQDAAQGWDGPLTHERLCRWHAALFPTGQSGLTKIVVGAYRSAAAPMQIISGPYGRETVHYEAVPGATVNAQMQALLSWFNSSRMDAQLDGLVRAALAHLHFETVHPFEDGNGRIGRAIVDLALAQDMRAAWRMHGLSQRLMKEREAYYHALNSAQRAGTDVTAWVLWFLGVFARACTDSLTVVEEAVERAQYWSRFREVALSPHQHKALNKLLDAGPGRFEGGMTPRKFMALTNTSSATATRELSALVAVGMLVRKGAGRSVRYELPMERWQWRPAP